MAGGWAGALHGDGAGFGGCGAPAASSAASTAATKAGYQQRYEHGTERDLPHVRSPQQRL